MGRQGLVAQSDAVHVPGFVRLQDEVGLGGKFLEKLPTVGGLYVQRNASLVHAIGPPEEAFFGMRVVLVEGASEPGVGAADRFDFDDVGSHVGQRLAAPVEPALGQVQGAVGRQGSVVRLLIG